MGVVYTGNQQCDILLIEPCASAGIISRGHSRD